MQRNVNLNMVFRSSSKGNKTENVISFTKIQRLTAPRIIDQFKRKMGQKKREYVKYQLLQEFFSKIFLCTRTVSC